jgi:SAM-dependent methyltransferase
VDFSEQAIRIARGRGGEDYTVGNGEALPYKTGTFDYLTSIGSLEHYEDPLLGAREMARILAPGGTALILLPNTFGILHNVWTALRKGLPAIDQQPIQRYGTVKEWEELLREGGLGIHKVYKYEREFPLNWADARWYLHHPKNLIRLLLTPLVPLNWACCFVFICGRLPDQK